MEYKWTTGQLRLVIKTIPEGTKLGNVKRDKNGGLDSRSFLNWFMDYVDGLAGDIKELKTEEVKENDKSKKSSEETSQKSDKETS